jgi:magnesium chelatase subunit D
MTQAERVHHTGAQAFADAQAFASAIYPFPAIVGYEAATRALLMLAVDCELRGVLIRSGNGSDAGTLARSFGALISDLHFSDAGSISTSQLVELPINISDDRLLGGLDLEETIASGKPKYSPGVLSKADGRVLYVNNINLLEAATCGHLADALDDRCVRIEREGFSALHKADFTLVGTFDPDEGEVPPLLRDRIGLIVDAEAESKDDNSIEFVDRALRFDENPAAFVEAFAHETSLLKREIESSRARLPQMRITAEQLRELAEAAVRLGVEGNRADVFAARTARASAALTGRDFVTDEDLIIAIQLVLLPRATSVPQREQERQLPDDTPADTSGEQNSETNDDGGGDSAISSTDALILGALDAQIPDDLLTSEQRANRFSRSGKRLKGSKATRGRYVRSQIHRGSPSRVAIDATLRAAAPFQRARLRLSNSLNAKPDVRRGAASLDSRVRIEAGDLRYKAFKHRSGMLYIFAVDASGSMAINRIAQAKGALTRLLQGAYLHRDQVALVSFRRETAEVLLTPTRSVELAKRLTEAIPAGGGTPLAAGIAKALEVARSAKLRGMPQAMLVLFTDGRANVKFAYRGSGSPTTISDELRQLGVLLHKEDVKTVVIDTQSKYIGRDEGKAVAELLGARYFSLSRSDAKSMYQAITSAAELHRDV